MAADRGKNALELRLAAAATPERVAAAATLLARMLQAMAPSLPGDAVTLVVHNRDTRAMVRTWSPDAQRAVQAIVRILQNPTTAAAREAHAPDVAAALVEEVKPLHGLEPRFYKPRGRKPIASVDDVFMNSIRYIARHVRGAPAVRGTTTIYTHVYRVGRLGEETKMKARLSVGGPSPQDIAIADGVAVRFFDAAKLGISLPVTIHATWIRTDEGTLVLDARRSTALDVDLEWRPGGGAQLGSELESATADAFDDLEDVIAHIEGDS
jgi:hypothetical protein